MKYYLLVAFFVAAVVAAPFDIAEDEEGEQYYLVPVHRQKRDAAETAWKVTETGAGIGHKGTVWQNDNSKVDASILAGKNWNTHGIKPDEYTGRFDYTNQQTGAGAFVEANRVMGAGTDVNAGLKYYIHQNKDFTVDLTGQYDRHFGGPSGTGHPDYSAMLNVNVPFHG